MTNYDIKEIQNLNIPKEKIFFNELMKNHTTFKIGGPAECFVKIENIGQLKEILKYTNVNNIPLNLIGNGSNILVLDSGIKGVVLKLEMQNIEIEKDIEKKKCDKIKVIADAGVKMNYFAQKLLQNNISGFEELAGIPGTIGGAIMMNAGAHGKEMKDIVSNVICMDYNGNTINLSNSELKFEYRKSILKNKEYIILQVEFILKKGKNEEIKALMDKYLTYRKERQPIEYPSAGSTFKRGKDFITAKLIDDAGLKGYTIGDAMVSKKHSGFIINKGNATAKDVLELVKYIQDKVYEKFEKKIELEIEIIGHGRI